MGALFCQRVQPMKIRAGKTTQRVFAAPFANKGKTSYLRITLAFPCMRKAEINPESTRIPNSNSNFMYAFTLFAHSWVRWILLILALVVIARSYMGWLGKQPYSKADNALSGSFMGLMHLQAVLGLLLYVVYSPYLKTAMEMGMGAAMKDPTIRMWSVEHISVMLIALVVAQVGRSRTRRIADAVKKHKTQAIFYTVALVLILSRIPWGEAARMARAL